MNVDVNVVVVLLLILLDDLVPSVDDVRLGDGVEEAREILIEEHEVPGHVVFLLVGVQELMDFFP